MVVNNGVMKVCIFDSNYTSETWVEKAKQIKRDIIEREELIARCDEREKLFNAANRSNHNSNENDRPNWLPCGALE